MLLLCELRKRGFAAKVIRGVGFIFPFFLRVSSSWLCSFLRVKACVHLSRGSELALCWCLPLSLTIPNVAFEPERDFCRKGF
jgi:hypothetical protein